MKHIVVDIETNGSNPYNRSMISLGAVEVTDGQITGEEFYAEMRPLWSSYEPEAYAVNGFTHEQALTFEKVETVMPRFLTWLKERQVRGQRLHFVSDNAGFDWMFVCCYLWKFVGENPFGFSPMSLTWYYKGMHGSRSKFQQFRSQVASSSHNHNALQDAMGNAEALVALLKKDKSLQRGT
jgi:DNA polymerase III alpha subunit (gram-positive type)